MKRIAIACLALAFATACGGVTVLDRDEYQGAKLPRPGRILVYDFAVTPEDLPDFTLERESFASRDTEQSAEELELGRKLGKEVAEQLVERIEKMGLHAARAEAGQTPPKVNDLSLVGAFTSIDKGSALKRVVIGFGMGSSELTTHVAGYEMTASGYRQLGSGSTASGKNRMMGIVVPTVVTIATANPIGLIVGGAVKAEGELSGRTTIEGTAKKTAKEIAEVLEEKFEEQGWID